MRKAGLAGDFWPTPSQEMLLQVALLPPDRAAAVWHDQRGFDLDHLEEGSYALMALVGHALSRVAPDDPLLPRLTGLRRRNWYREQPLFEKLRGVLEGCEAAGSSPVLLGGVPLASLYYPDPGLRIVTPLDLLVAENESPGIARALEKAGWRQAAHTGSSWQFEDGEGTALIVREKVLEEFSTPGLPGGLAADMRSGAVMAEVAHAAVHVLSPGDELLHACLRGARRSPWPDVHWVADSAAVLSASGEGIDWGRVTALASRAGAILALQDTVTYLCQLLDLSFPQSFRRDLASVPVTRRDRRVYRWSDRPFRRDLATYLRAAPTGLLPAIAGFPAFLRDAWGLDHMWQLPLAGARRAVAAVTARRSGD